MKPWRLLETSVTADGKKISLHEHDGMRSIRVNGLELMSTRHYTSEQKLAELACEHLRQVSGAHVLIGGLGFGYTLQAALGTLPADSSVVVAEILEAVIRWNTTPTDARVNIVQRDVVALIAEASGTYDAIMLDVDNGPYPLTASGNRRLYDDEGLRATKRALRAGGCAAWWSAGPDVAFGKRIALAGFRVQSHRWGGHSIYTGMKSA